MVSRDDYSEKMVTCQERKRAKTLSLIILRGKYINIFWVCYFYFFGKLTLKPKKELNILRFYVPKINGKFMTEQVANTFGHVR